MGFQSGSGTNLLSVVGSPDLTGEVRREVETRGGILCFHYSVGSLDQPPQHHLGACDKCRILGQRPAESVPLTKITSWFISMLRFEKHYNI